MPNTNIGRVQLEIMRVLWSRGKANAREITDALSEQRDIAHSTVQTLLRQLEEKGSVGHEIQNRTFIYFPLVEEDRVTRTATRDLIDRLFGGDAAGLVAYLLEQERIPRKELQGLRKLIEKKTSKRGS